jgi:hypothetical protein
MAYRVGTAISEFVSSGRGHGVRTFWGCISGGATGTTLALVVGREAPGRGGGIPGAGRAVRGDELPAPVLERRTGRTASRDPLVSTRCRPGQQKVPSRPQIAHWRTQERRIGGPDERDRRVATTEMPLGADRRASDARILPSVPSSSGNSPVALAAWVCQPLPIASRGLAGLSPTRFRFRSHLWTASQRRSAPARDRVAKEPITAPQPGRHTPNLPSRRRPGRKMLGGTATSGGRTSLGGGTGRLKPRMRRNLCTASQNVRPPVPARA